MTRITRRHAVTGLAAFCALIGPTQASERNTRAWQPRTYDDGLIPDFSFELIEMDLQGSLNVYALDTETGRAAVWGPQERVPAGWEAAALTGAEGDNTLSVATIFPPDRLPLLLAAFITGANRDPDFQFARHAELVRIATTNLMLPPYDPYADE